MAEDAAAAIDNMNESELCGRTLRVNLAKPLKITPNRYGHNLISTSFLLYTLYFALRASQMPPDWGHVSFLFTPATLICLGLVL